MEDFTEKQTREEIIDKKLSQIGWFDKYIKREVNSVKSNFKTKDYVLYGSSIEKGVDKFIDYLLLGEDNSPLAIIEAKKFSANPQKGRIQARSYVKDIESQIGIVVPIFLTNGNDWIHIDSFGVERTVSGPFTQEVLKRRLEMSKTRKDLEVVKVNTKILDRTKSISIIKTLEEHFSKGHRKALIGMATGTGKTRVSMALIDVLLNANYIRNVLFVADRISLANQADEEGLSKFFHEPSHKIHEQGFSTTARFYTSTIQTLMSRSKKGKFMFEEYNCGFFDLIIFDEAHRSIYDKNNSIMKYFDAIQIGLTATPKDSESKNTFALFDCADGIPTVEYSYDEAVRDGILVTYEAHILETEVLSLGIEGKNLDSYLKDELRRQEEEPDKLVLTGKEFGRVFMDNKTNELIVREFMSRCYRSDDNLPCKTIFFCVNQKHANNIKEIFDRLYPSISKHVQVITSDEYRAQDEVKRFKKNSEPRIALSVGMLDTGVDVPEIMNLVFVKPVFSHQRFWQMIGRGTRSLSACKHKEWLPLSDKKDFRVLDFKIGDHSNVEHHQLKRASKDGSENLMQKMFLSRVELLNKNLTDEEREILSKLIVKDIDSLGEESFILQPKLSLIKKIKKSNFELEDYLTQLKEDIAPFMILKQMGDANVAAFMRDTEKLFGYLLGKRNDKIEKVRAKLCEMVEFVISKDNLYAVKEKEKELFEVLQDKFWDELTFEKIDWLLIEIAPLMKFFERTKTRVYQIDKVDKLISSKVMQKELEEDGKLKKFLEENSIALKLKNGEGITSNEIKELENGMKKLGYGFTIELIQNLQGKDFISFLYEVIGISHEKDPRVEMEKAFDNFIIKNSHYTSKQVEFLRLLKKVFIERKSIDLKDFAKEPFKDEVHLFEFPQLVEIVDKVNELRWK